MKKEFIDGLNTAVFTTRFVLEKRTVILYVYHYEEDGAWEFLGREDCVESDYRVISLDEIITIDNSILEVSNIPFGYFAYRENVKDGWKVNRIS